MVFSNIFNYMFIQRNQLLCRCSALLLLLLLFPISSEALHLEIYHPVLGIPKFWARRPGSTCCRGSPSALWRGHSATPTLREGVWQPLAGSGQLSLTSALKNSQFPFPLRRNFFVKFQAENLSSVSLRLLVQKVLPMNESALNWQNEQRKREEFY